MEYRMASEEDLDRLAEWNAQLIRDEGHRNAMSLADLRIRMRDWIAEEYRAVLFCHDNEPVAYALFRESADEVYLRQFFVRRDKRKLGLGRRAIEILRQEIWPIHKRLTVDVLCINASAILFWRAVGFRDYCLTLEIMPEESNGST